MENGKKPPIDIGIVNFDRSWRIDDGELEFVEKGLSQSFPEFDWRIQSRRVPWILLNQQVDPLDLLSFGYREKLKGGFDVVIVLSEATFSPLKSEIPRAILSNALEVAVAQKEPDAEPGIARLVTALLGHLWGETVKLNNETFDDQQSNRIRARLEEIADARVEEESDGLTSGKGSVSHLRLLWGALRADPKSLLFDVIRYRPWAQPFRMGRLTAAAAVSSMILIMAAESWEIATGISNIVLIVLTLVSLLASSVFLVKSQDWGWKSGGDSILLEQAARTYWVVGLSIATGMVFFWATLLTGCLMVGCLIDDSTLERWLNQPVTGLTRFRYAVFTAAIGLLAAIAGGNFEEERNLKIRLLVDKEIG